MLTVSCNAANPVYVEYSSYPYFYIQGVVQKVITFVPTTTKIYTIETSKHMTDQDTSIKLIYNGNIMKTAGDTGDIGYAKLSCQLSANTTYQIIVTSYIYMQLRRPDIFLIILI